MIVDNILEEKEPEVFTITEIPEDQFELKKGYYCYVYVTMRFKKEFGVERKEYQADV